MLPKKSTPDRLEVSNDEDSISIGSDSIEYAKKSKKKLSNSKKLSKFQKLVKSG